MPKILNSPRTSFSRSTHLLKTALRLESNIRMRWLSIDLPRFHADDVEACCLQTVGQVLSERASFQTDTVDIKFEIIQIGDNVLNIRGKHPKPTFVGGS
jgi:hypothetical protein